MHRAGRTGVVAALLLAAVACGGNSPSVGPTLPSTTVGSEATLGLTPIGTPIGTVGGSVTSVPLTTFDTLPGLESDPTTSTVLGASTTLPALTSLDPISLPDPDPPPLPESHENKNQIGYLEIPALRIAENLFEGVTLSTLNSGPGHWPGSAFPGQVGNVVVAGHRVSHTHPFRDLDQLKPGDEVIFSTVQGRNVYLVDRTQIVTPDALWIVDQTPEKTATLFACHPKGTTTSRIVVFLTYAPELSQPAA